MENLRKKLTNIERKVGNFFYDGLGEILSTNINKKELAGLGAASFLSLVSLLNGCDQNYSYSSSSKIPIEHQPIYGEYKRGDITQKDAAHKLHILGVMNEGYYLKQIQDFNGDGKLNPNEIGIFYIDNSLRIFDPVKGTTKITSGDKVGGEKGLYMLKKEDIKKISLRTEGPRAKRADVEKTKDIIKKRKLEGELFDYVINEDANKWKLPTENIPGLGESYIIEVEENKISKNKDSLNWYVIPVNGTKIVIESSCGNIHLDTENSSVQRAKFVSFGKLLEERIKNYETEKKLLNSKNKSIPKAIKTN